MIDADITEAINGIRIKVEHGGDAFGLDVDCVADAVGELVKVIGIAEARALADPDNVTNELAKVELDALRRVFIAMLASDPEALTVEHVTSQLHGFATSSVARMAEWARRRANYIQKDEAIKQRYVVQEAGEEVGIDYDGAVHALINTLAKKTRLTRMGTRVLDLDITQEAPLAAPLAQLTDAERFIARSDFMSWMKDAVDKLTKRKHPLAGDPDTLHKMVILSGKSGLDYYVRPDGKQIPIPVEIAAVGKKLFDFEEAQFARQAAAGVPRYKRENYFRRPELDFVRMRQSRGIVLDYFKKHVDLTFLGKFKTTRARDIALEKYVFDEWATLSNQAGNSTAHDVSHGHSTQKQRVHNVFDTPEARAAEFQFYDTFKTYTETWDTVLFRELNALVTDRVIHEQFGMGGISVIDDLFKKYLKQGTDIGKISPALNEKYVAEYTERRAVLMGDLNEGGVRLPNLSLALDITSRGARTAFLQMAGLFSLPDTVVGLDFGTDMRRYSKTFRENGAKVEGMWTVLKDSFAALGRTEKGMTEMARVIESLGLSNIWAHELADTYGYLGGAGVPRDMTLNKGLVAADGLVRGFERLGTKANPMFRLDRFRMHQQTMLTLFAMRSALEIDGSFGMLAKAMPPLHDALSAWGFTEADWKKLKDYTGRVGDSDAPDFVVSRIFDIDRLAFNDPSLLSKLRGALKDEAEVIIGKPDVVMQRMLTWGARRDSVAGMTARSVMFFKSVMATLLLIRNRRKFRNALLLSQKDVDGLKDVTPRQRYDLTQVGWAMGKYAMATTLAGTALTALSELLRGRDPRNLAAWEWVLRSLGTGGMGILMDPLIQGTKDGRDGATLGSLQDQFSVVSAPFSWASKPISAIGHAGAAIIDDTSKGSRRSARKAVRDVSSFTGLEHNIYTAAAVRSFFDNWLFDLRPPPGKKGRNRKKASQF